MGILGNAVLGAVLVASANAFYLPGKRSGVGGGVGEGLGLEGEVPPSLIRLILMREC